MELFTDTINDTIQAELHPDGVLEITAGDNVLANVGGVTITTARAAMVRALGEIGNQVAIVAKS